MQEKIISELEKVSDMVTFQLEKNLKDTFKKQIEIKKCLLYSADDIGLRLRPYLIYKIAITHNICEKRIIPIATAVEFMQLSTLVIDDILDNSNKRNRKLSSFKKYGARKAILIGEYLKSMSIKLLLNQSDFLEYQELYRVISLLEDSYREILLGQFIDIISEHKIFSSINDYYSLIYSTTGNFIQNSILIGAVISQINGRKYESLKRFGYYLGLAFQLRDDILDIIGISSETGKNKLMDIKNNKFRLPVILFYKFASNYQKKEFKSILFKKNISKKDYSKIFTLLKNSNSIEKSILLVGELCDKAMNELKCIKNPQMKNDLIEICHLTAKF